MRRLLPLLLLASAAACAGYQRPVMIDDDPAPRSLAPSAEAEEARARQRIREIEERIARGDLPKIQFEFDKAEILADSYPTLDRVAEVILSSERLKLMIFAHTDDVGTDEYNLDLSRRRAKAVKTYLALKGVPVPSMRFHGYGESKPLADNSTEEGRAKNRRVEFYVTTREWNSVY
ncbi:MAG: OmpA family protein [Elusimicrobia bacterium]|nr:OmpA family protein [Elusimicrobiota bacterium]